MAAAGIPLSFARGVNHGKQTSLFREPPREKERAGVGARAKSVFALGIMAGRVTAFGNIVAGHRGWGGFSISAARARGRRIFIA